MEIEELRKKIDDVDDSLLSLFLERMELSDEIAGYKKDNRLRVTDRLREREILKSVSEKAGDKELYAYRLFSTIFELSKASQRQTVTEKSEVGPKIEKMLTASRGKVFPDSATVACQGTEGSNSQIACDKLFSRGNIVYVKSFEAVFDAVSSGLCQYGILPIENSSTGSVRQVYDLLQRKEYSIVRSTRLCIRHELMALPGTKISDIKTIYSHEQALGQCSEYLEKLKGVKSIPCANTAVAAQMVAESGDRTAAAISSASCAELYGLAVLSDDIQNSANNYTRFICISHTPAIFPGSNRISLILGCDNRPGALYEILSLLSALGVNMSKLESCPVTGSDFEFIFFLELDASVETPGIVPMLAELERSCGKFVFLGGYSEV